MSRHDHPFLPVAALLALALSLGCGLMPPEQQGQPTPPPPEQRTLPPPGYVIVWQDEFDGTSLDATRWTPFSGPRLDSIATPNALDVRNGILTLTTYTQAGVHYTGFLSTEGKFAARYGYYEARIRFDDAPGSWCAFWLQSPTIGVPLGDPAHAGVEADVVEHRVTDQGGWDALRDMVALNLNWDGYDVHKQNVQKVMALPDGSPIQGQWHTFAVLWTASGYTWYVDDVQLWTSAAAVSQRTEDLRLTCEVADGSWAGYVPKGGYGPKATSAAKMEVDWVRVWQLPP